MIAWTERDAGCHWTLLIRWWWWWTTGCRRPRPEASVAPPSPRGSALYPSPRCSSLKCGKQLIINLEAASVGPRPPSSAGSG